AVAGGTVPPSLNVHRRSLRCDIYRALPPAKIATYCSPLTEYVEAGALAPAPVWNFHSSSPVLMSYATRFPSDSPWKRSPPAVLNSPLPPPIGYFVFFCHTILFVVGSIAVSVPERCTPAGR